MSDMSLDMCAHNTDQGRFLGNELFGRFRPQSQRQGYHLELMVSV